MKRAYLAKTMAHVGQIVQLTKEIQDTTGLMGSVPLQQEQFAYWLLGCIQASSVEIICYGSDEELDGFMVLSETVYPWNHSIKYGNDIMFLAKKNGHRIVQFAKKIAKKREWVTLMLSTTCNQERVDRYMKHIGTQIGGVYYVSH